MNDSNDMTARKAYEALLRVSLLQPHTPDFHDFSLKVRDRAKRDYNYTFCEGEEVNYNQIKFRLLNSSTGIKLQKIIRLASL